jgi:hypothetical protein
MVDGAVAVGESAAPADPIEPTAADVPAPEVVVGASGNLANIYFLEQPGRMSLEAIEAIHPGLVLRLASHPGIGFLLVHSETEGPLVIGRDGVHHLTDGRVDGTDPLEPFEPHAPEHLLRLDGFEHVGDILVNSIYDPALEEVAAFEELVGSHGGFGGAQTRPFLLAPTRLGPIDQPLVGAPAVHHQLVRWADELGVGPTSGAKEAPLVAARRAGRPRGIGLVTVLTGITSLSWLLFGALFIIGGLETGEGVPAAAGILLVTLGIVGMFVTAGLRRRREWARTATMAWYAIGVIQALGALATEGAAGVASLGAIQVLVSVFVFFYLTRPHVRAAFGG